jgi:hypothetical protein
MRVMVLVKADEHSEAGEMPSEEMIAAMMAFNEELVKAGVMLDGDGLQPSSRGVRIHFAGDEREVVPGPFAATRELVAGYWLWNVASLDEAIAWARKCPKPMTGDCDLELRPVFEAQDFGDSFTPELQAQSERLRDELARRPAG